MARSYGHGWSGKRPAKRIEPAGDVAVVEPEPVAELPRRRSPVHAYEAAWAAPGLNRSQREVLHLLLVHGDLTDSELVTAARMRKYTQSDSSLRTRRVELTRKGFLQAVPERRKTSSGRTARVWTVVEGGPKIH